MDRHLGVRANGQRWTDRQMILALALLNLSGGDCMEDIKILEGDEGFCRILRRTHMAGMKRKARRELERRWRKVKRRKAPLPSAIFRYLAS